jgi:hypothetical protein
MPRKRPALTLISDILSCDRELAATIGLDQAILLQYLSQHVRLPDMPESTGVDQSSSERQVTVRTMCAHLAFWDEATLRQHCAALEDQGLIRIRKFQDELHCTLMMLLPEISASHHAPVPPQSGTQQKNTPGIISPNWSPGPGVVELLQRQHTIDPARIAQMRNEFIVYWRDRAEPRHSWDSLFMSYVATQASKAERVSARAPLDSNWMPNALCVEQLNLEGIDNNFINTHIPGFIGYWSKENPHAGDWESRFIRFCKRQWEYEDAQRRNTYPISKDWQPDDTAYTLLQSSGIDRAYAESKLPEFILYWLEKGVAFPDWSMRFVSRVKQIWQSEHGQHDGGDGWGAFIERHTDPSWRDGAG